MKVKDLVYSNSFSMENFTIFDDYQRYPILKGEVELFEELRYDDFLQAHQRTIETYKIEDQQWADRIRSWGNAHKSTS